MISQADSILFRQTVENDRLIDKDTVASNTQKHPIFSAYSHAIEAEFSANEVLSYNKSSAPKKLIRQLQQGKISAAPTLDLHGHTAIKACELMAEFIYAQQHQQFIHIIHGKGYNCDLGKSILKSQVFAFLCQHPQILAFHSCAQQDGGTGAVFALLKT